ncbi:hypothetical protein EYF80_039864 [Liparis tanakae]|uniref:Uncharacterized protein n=1 Tax=Liparis tanakae TaxID=230148 RepID=A0A4Z2G8Q7_9TELE|nr:hypothetical protein EYF80_039864 [Liparis tanakae]
MSDTWEKIEEGRDEYEERKNGEKNITPNSVRHLYTVLSLPRGVKADSRAPLPPPPPPPPPPTSLERWKRANMGSASRSCQREELVRQDTQIWTVRYQFGWHDSASDYISFPAAACCLDLERKAKRLLELCFGIPPIYTSSS